MEIDLTNLASFILGSAATILGILLQEHLHNRRDQRQLGVLAADKCIKKFVRLGRVYNGTSSSPPTDADWEVKELCQDIEAEVSKITDPETRQRVERAVRIVRYAEYAIEPDTRLRAGTLAMRVAREALAAHIRQEPLAPMDAKFKSYSDTVDERLALGQ